MRDDYTDMTVVLDRSGSMSSIKDDMEGGFNRFIEEQKKVPGELRVTLFQFDTEYECVYENKPVSDVPSLSLVPRGSTALLDAVGKAIAKTGERLKAMSEASRPGKVLFVVITDGQENSSREFKKEAVRRSIDEQTNNYKWSFTYLGANVDAFAEAGSMAIPTGGALNYSATPVGVRAAYNALSQGVASYRCSSGSGAAVNYNDDQRKAASGK